MIRRAKHSDIDGINNLLNEVLFVHHLGRPDIFKEKGEKYTEDELKMLINDENNHIFVYESDSGEILGHCFCKTIDREERPSTHAYKTLFIDDLCVEENVRGKHIGKQLYEYAKEYARENGYYNVVLHAWECNQKAVGFYKHLGMNIQQYTMEEILM